LARQLGDPCAIHRGEPCDSPQAPVNASRRLAPRRLASRREEADFVAFPDGAARELDGFRHMALEVQAERATFTKRLDLALEVGRELWVRFLDLAQEVAQPRHACALQPRGSRAAISNRAIRGRGCTNGSTSP
jgi:hypothetical protein